MEIIPVLFYGFPFSRQPAGFRSRHPALEFVEETGAGMA
jgi:hypothetical protein